MKKLISIFLIAMISMSHLNLADAFCGIAETYSISADKDKKDFSEKEQEKESKAEDKSSEEKYVAKHSYSSLQHLLPGTGMYAITRTRLNTHPIFEAEPKPPKQA